MVQLFEAIPRHEPPMPYRRTENVARRLAARHAAIIAAARETASEGGMAAVQIAPVARRAGIAAGTVYRYFPGKTDLVAAVLAEISAREIAALRRAADVAPGPLSALSAAIMTFASRALRHRRLAYAAIAEPVDAELDAARRKLRQAFAAEFSARIAAAVGGGHLPDQDVTLSAAALVGLLVEGLVGPLAPDSTGGERAVVQSLTLVALRALGVADARARGLVVQTVVRDQ
jgi:AcrR family transcriptional regulator